MSGSSTRSADSAAAEPEPGAVAPSSDAARADARAPRRRHVARAGLVAGVAATVLIVDQLSKQWALERLSGARIVEVVGSLRFNLTWNTGTAFSLGSGRNLGPLIALLALGVVAYLLWSGQSSTKLGAVAAGMVAGGAIGNLVDRAFRSGPAGAEAGFMGGAVVDFVDVQWWPVFNVADAGIVVGAILLVVASLFEPDPDPARGGAAQTDQP